MNVLLGKPPRMHRSAQRESRRLPAFETAGLAIEACALDVLRHPTVASKSFLVTIGDRTVGGMNSRDSMVGPWQVPVADCAVTMMSFEGYAGEAMAIGERTPLAVIDAAAASRMAIGEAITNIAGADVAARRREAVVQLDGCVRASRARTRASSTRSALRANCARRSASAYRSARIRCR